MHPLADLVQQSASEACGQGMAVVSVEFPSQQHIAMHRHPVAAAVSLPPTALA
jgi:hypothetical protein